MKNPLLTSINIAWAAGFLEGEGHFGCNVNSPVILANQVYRDPIDKLQAMFGGTVYPIKHSAHALIQRPNMKDAFGWRINGSAAIGVMMTIYCLISSSYKLEQIENAIITWKNAEGTKRMRGTGICKNGHKLVEGNLYYAGPDNKYVRCRACGLERAKKKYELILTGVVSSTELTAEELGL